MTPADWPDVYPMIRGGGMFIAIMGIGMLLGALVPTRRQLFLMVGAAMATLALVLFARKLAFGAPSAVQVWFLFGSIGIEVVLIRVAVSLYRTSGERAILLAILFVVGLHFIPMAVAFGPLCAALGVALCAIAGIGLWVRPDIPLNRVWAADGVLKVGFGVAMFLIRP